MHQQAFLSDPCFQSVHKSLSSELQARETKLASIEQGDSKSFVIASSGVEAELWSCLSQRTLFGSKTSHISDNLQGCKEKTSSPTH